MSRTATALLAKGRAAACTRHPHAEGAQLKTPQCSNAQIKGMSRGDRTRVPDTPPIERAERSEKGSDRRPKGEGLEPFGKRRRRLPTELECRTPAYRTTGAK
jgi:hypothetical protein